MFETLSAFLASLTGKAVLSTAIAAASVGGLHAADVVELPGLPDETTEQELSTAAAEEETTDLEAEETQETQEVEEIEGADEESEFSLAMQLWSECVDAASAEHDAATESTEGTEGETAERFDPEAACGERPQNAAAADNPPAEVQERIAAVQAWADCVPENAPDHHTACGPNPAAESSDRQGPPEQTGQDAANRPEHAGPPEEAGDRSDDESDETDESVEATGDDADVERGRPEDTPGRR